MNDLIVEIRKNLLLNFRVNILIWKISVIRCYIKIQRIFFSEAIKRRAFL